MHIVATLIIVAAFGYLIGVTVWSAYHSQGDTKWERVVDTFRDSATLAWTRINALSTGAVAALVWVSQAMGAPGVKEAIEPYLGPNYMLAYVAFVLIGAEITRRRTLP